MRTFLGFFYLYIWGPLFKSVNGLIKEKVTHFVFFNAHRAYAGKRKKNCLIQIILVGVTISPLRAVLPLPPQKSGYATGRYW